jgi:hypothetical protein
MANNFYGRKYYVRERVLFICGVYPYFPRQGKIFRQQNFTNKIDAKVNIGNYSHQYRKYFLLFNINE